MPLSRLLRSLLPAAVLAAVVPVASAVSTAAPAWPAAAGDDAVVVAVIDSGFSPYHWDFAAERRAAYDVGCRALARPPRQP